MSHLPETSSDRSRMPRARRRTVWAALVLALAPLLAGAAIRTQPARPIELIETRPIETTLGNPALASTLETWLEMIRGARRSIDLEQFYLSTWPGEPMEAVIAELGNAAKRGVRIRLLLDARMYKTYPGTADSLAKLRNFEVRRIDIGRIAGGVQHAKFFLIDDDLVFLGSQNTDWRALKHIHELGVRIRDARVARDFRSVFEMDWAAATPAGAEPDTTEIARAVQTTRAPGILPYAIVQAPGDTVWLWPSWSPKRFVPDTTQWDRDRLIATLDGAAHEVVAQSLNYGLGRERDLTLDEALRRAAARGVRVRLIVSDWEMGASGMRDLQALARVPNVEVRLSTIAEWSGGYIPFARVEHCKYLVADTLVTWLGTSNWEPNYFHSSRNLAVTMRNRPLASAARQVFETVWNDAGVVALNPDSTYAPKIRGEEPPPGRKKYGG